MSKLNPLSISPTSTPTLPLEQIVPMFLFLATACIQASMIRAVPVIYGAIFSKSSNELKVITLADNFCGEPPKYYQHVPLTQFNKCPPSDLEAAKTAYLQLSFAAKCNRMTSCFGYFVMRTLETHQMTYGGEKIIGWTVHYGNLDLKHPLITKFTAVGMNNMSDLKEVRECLLAEKPIPKSLNAYELFVQFGDSTHIWLTFVTESGKLFDLDLSQAQFGLSPFACITPASEMTEYTLNGTCKRYVFVGVNNPIFAETVEHLCHAQANSVKRLSGGSLSPSVAGIIKTYNALVDSLLHLCSKNECPTASSNPETFWESLNYVGTL